MWTSTLKIDDHREVVFTLDVAHEGMFLKPADVYAFFQMELVKLGWNITRLTRLEDLENKLADIANAVNRKFKIQTATVKVAIANPIYGEE